MSRVPEYSMSRRGFEESKSDCHNAWMKLMCPMCGDKLQDTHGELMHHVIFHLTGRRTNEPGVIYAWIEKSEQLTSLIGNCHVCSFCGKAIAEEDRECCGSGRNPGYWLASHLAKSEQCALMFLLSDNARMEI